MTRAVRLAALLAAALPLGAAAGGGRDGKGDTIQRLESDPSASASEKLKRLYAGTKSPDQRFWLLRSLEFRVKRHKDEAALEALLAAAGDPVPMVRGSALRSLSAFEALPREAVKTRWIERLDKAAKGSAEDPAPVVREGAQDLLRALDVFRDPAARGAPAPPEAPPPSRARLARSMGVVWVLVLPLSVGLWLASGRPVFDASVPDGRLAVLAAAELWRRRGPLLLCSALWGALLFLLVGWGFELLVLVLGHPFRQAESWGAAYLGVWFCLLGPGAFTAAAVSRRPEGGGLAAALEAVPQVALLSLAAALALAPLELLYRALWRGRARGPGGSPARLLEEGVFAASARAAAASAEEGVGLVPALLEPAAKPGPRLGLTVYDPRFTFLAAAPCATVLCALAAAARPADWTSSRAAVLVGCALWAWGVLAGLLMAVASALQGVSAGARHRAARGLESPAQFKALMEAS
ncbi:MAG: hypothetical protein HYZ75_06065 [Elusimicrobia bacterium]|nr:hypothetical protein [Elusimicrobiota bacterium]